MNSINQAFFPSLSSGGELFPARDELLTDIFAIGVALGPDRDAIVFGENHITYGALDAAADRVARSLRAQGIGRGAFVGLFMARGAALHVALLGILKAGAAYIPFDADAPAERVAECLADCRAKAIIVDQATGPKLAGAVALPVLDQARLEAEAPPGPACFPRELGVTAEDIAYVIYTSGSTGKPKGVMTTHRNICHFLRSANTVYGVGAPDIAFQGCSVAFDLSLEEIFIPYMVGATLWVAGRDVLDDVETLPARLAKAGISVIDTVPTLLAMIEGDIPSLRIIILGGESLPAPLVERWWKAGRRLFNSYGPTEATVVATVAEMRPGEPVTIGRPIPGYVCHVVDEALQPVGVGVDGELLIGGPGIARGYLNRPELTAEKFVTDPFPGAGRLYRTGDLVAWDREGRLEFKGRIDDQVKIRGFRIELGEIESRLAAFDAIAQAAVAVRRETGTDRLAAFVVPAQGRTVPGRTALREALRKTLPPYMVPDHVEVVEKLPRLISGKLDRKALAALPLSAPESAGSQEQPADAVEAALLAAAQQVFPGTAIAFDADFFLDLGGHSLLAARFVSAVRQTPSLARLTLQDVYAKRSLRRMAETLRAQDRGQAAAAIDRSFPPVPLARRFLCGLAQAAAMPLILSLITAPWLGVFVAYQLFSGEDHDFLRETLALLATYGVINAASIAIAIAGKWLAIGRAKPGRYPLWGVYYYRWWLAQRFTSMVHIKWFQGTPIMRLFLRALGARIGEGAIIADIEAGAIDLIEIGAHASVGGKTQLANASVIGNQLVIGRLSIGPEANTGTGCIIGHDTVIGRGAELADLTAIAPGTTIGDWEVWEGSPGRATGHVDQADLPPLAEAGPLRRGVMAGFYALMLLLLPPITLMPIIPAFYLFDALSDTILATLGLDYLTILPLLAWPTAMALILVTVLLIALVRWVVLPRVRAGTYSIHSLFYLRKWVVALSTELTLETLSSLYATVYMRNWYRLMGAKIGKDAEISTNLAGRYDLVEIGEKCFIADEVVLGDEDVKRGWMILKPVRTGPRVFVGNDAVVPPGSELPEGTLIGIKSRPPLHQAVEKGDVWFGSPPLKLPVRQRFDDVQANWTYEPSRWRRIGRAIFEAFSVSLPTMLFITFGTLAVELLAPSILARDFSVILPLFAACSVAISCALVAAAIAVKWLLMGTYRPTTKPMWSWWALKTEAVAVMYWGMAGKVLLDHLRGTPMLPWVLRLFGCKFGQGVFMDTTDITEFDCVTVGDHCAINAVAALQTHLYEDRVMKVGTVTLGDGVSVGTGSTVLYDTHIGDFAEIGDLTVIMKGEEIPAHGQWQGAPAESIG